MASKYVFNISDYPFFNEKTRIKTFNHWPFGKYAKCNPQKMAEAGWFAVEGADEPDLAQCMTCDKQLDGWEESDDPWQEHTKHCPNCPFVKINKRQTKWTIRDGLQFSCEVMKANYVKGTDAKISRLDDLVQSCIAKKLGAKAE